MTDLAAIPGGDANFLFAAAHSLFQGELQGITQIRTPSRATTTTAAATEDVAKNIAEDVTKATTAEAAGSASTGLAIHTGMAELVIGCPLLLIGEHLVGFLGFLELGQRLLIIRVTVRMVLHGQTSIGLFQILLTGILGRPQHFIIITFGHSGPF